jgi:DNA-binding MarR family transcriptional regulator
LAETIAAKGERSSRPSVRAAESAAAAAADHLDTIRKRLRGAIEAHAQELRVPLTGPQLLAVQFLFEELRASDSGLSVSALSRRMGLAHSTVSGIVDRLEQRELVRRVTRPEDRRFVSIELAPAVRQWLERELPAARLGPLVEALDAASPEERDLVLRGLETLRRLLESAEPHARSASSR